MTKPRAVYGIAADTRVDEDNEALSIEGLRDMARQINSTHAMPIKLQHYRKQVGVWTKAWVRNGRLYVKGEIDPNREKEIRKRLRLGISIGGVPQKTHVIRRGMRATTVLDGLLLREISLVSGPMCKRAVILSGISWIQKVGE